MSDKIAPRLGRNGFGILRAIIAIKKQIEVMRDTKIEKRIQHAESVLHAYRNGPPFKRAQSLYKKYMDKYHKENRDETAN